MAVGKKSAHPNHRSEAIASPALKTLTRRIHELEARIDALEEIAERPPSRAVHLPKIWNGNFREFAPTMRAEHIAYLYGRAVGGVKKAAQERSDKIPTPSESRPWNRDDVKRHYSRRIA